MECDKNCENCKYDDCICESKDYSDIDGADRLVDRDVAQEIAKMKAIENGTFETYKYNHSCVRKYKVKKYLQSEKGKAAQKRYIQSEKGKMAQKKYSQSEKGKAMERRKTQKRIASGKNAEYCRNYYRRKKERMLLEKGM